MKNTSCAFTGHRPQNFPWGRNDASDLCKRLKIALYNQIVHFANAGVTDFLSGMAEGADTWAAQSVLHLRSQSDTIKLHCILPCKAQAAKWDSSAQKLYYSILEQADSIVYVHQKYTSSCMLDRNKFLVNHAALLLAVYNGGQHSGTAATVRYARAQKRKIFILNPMTQIVTYDRY